AGPGVPATTRAREPAELVEAAGIAIDEQRMVVASVLDVNPFRDRVADSIALVCVLERDLRPWRLAGDNVERDSDRAAVPGSGAEVGVQAGVEPDRADQGRGIRCDGQLADGSIPRVRLRKDGAARRGGQSEGGRRARQRGDEKGCGEDGDGPHSVSIGVSAAAP